VDPPKSTETERTRLRASDLLVTIVGANTGDVCRVDFAPKSHFVCQSVALLRLADLSLAEYLTYVLISEVAQMQFRQFTYGAGRPHLSFDQIENTHVPVPPEAEGQEICSRLKSTFLGLDDTAMLTEERSAGVHLRQSILKAAFEGRLLKQDPRDATANGLLAPLTEQSGSMPPARRPRRRRDAIAAE
jgi:type I restriction enzyme S subunit